MLDHEKVSLVLAADYVGLSPEAFGAMENAGWIKRASQAGSIPVYLGADVKRLKSAAPPETPEQKLQKAIRGQREDLQAKIQKARDDLSALQGRCTHPTATMQGRSDTGNWDRSQDSYWYEFSCADCGKNWTEPQ
jgi:hypothetical protein